MNDRKNHVNAIFIDAVIQAGTDRGTTELACLLCGHGVPLDVAIRVLTRPWERRESSAIPHAPNPA